ncbi:MAG: hypothetical protein LCH82_07340 [Actinobacteria bacterium]|nr:hypothetical protein [Actinomycetota bacterium]
MVSRPRGRRPYFAFTPGADSRVPGVKPGRSYGITGGTQIPTPSYPGEDRPAGAPQDVPAQTPPQAPQRIPGQGGQVNDPMAGWPIPHKTWQTKNGSQVTVAGCCLPLPLLTTLGAAALGLARMRSRRP